MAQMWLWFVAGFAYVLLGIFNYRMATCLRLIDIQSPARQLTDFWTDEGIDKLKRGGDSVILEQHMLFNEGEITEREASRVRGLRQSVSPGKTNESGKKLQRSRQSKPSCSQTRRIVVFPRRSYLILARHVDY